MVQDWHWLTTKDIAEKSGLSLNTLKKYRSKDTLPKPDHYFNRTPVWKPDTVDTWVHTRRKLKPIPSKED